MRHATCARIAYFVALLAIAATVEATPILPADIAVGASVTGSFSFPISSSPPDQDPSPLTGRYLVSDSTARMVVEIGGFVFPSDLDGLLVEVTNSTFDFIQLIATGDQATFPFLTDLPHQNPSLDPLGFFALTFRFPATHLSNDAFPTSIDPLAALPNPGGPTPTGIYQRVEGDSTQKFPPSAFPEWLFQFDIDPLTMLLVLHDGVLTGTYSGTVAFLNPGDSPSVAPIPEPSSMILVTSGGLLMLRKIAARSNRNRLVRK
jgi:hypothetical protein